MEHETGGGAVVAGVQPFRQGSDVDALVVKLLNGLQSLSEVVVEKGLLEMLMSW